MDFIFISLLSVLFGGAASWGISLVAHRYGLIDHPNERSSHHEPTPKGGGICILAAFVFASLLLDILPGFWIPATFLSLVSFFGDVLDVSPKIRLPLQFIAAFALLTSISHTTLIQPYKFLLIIPLSVFIVGTVNFYNFMDGINGISTITGIVAFGFLSVFYFNSESDRSYSLLAICICLSCIGFLPFNVPKARVFMGDVGSILLGFVFAGMVIVLSKSFLDFICLTSFLFPFYSDELSTMAIRIKDRENLLQPHRRHLYQLLANEKGISHWKISVGFGLLQLMVGASVLLAKPFGIIAILSILAVYFAAFIGASVLIRRNLCMATSEFKNA